MTYKLLNKIAVNEVCLILSVAILLLIGVLFENNETPNSYKYLAILFQLSAYFISGWGVISKAIKNLVKGNVFGENFLMTIATLGAIIINELPEAVTVMLLYNVGEFLQKLAVDNSRRSIRSLLKIRPEFANVKQNGGELLKINPSEVKINDVVLVKPGEKIPLDGKVVNGSTYVDTFALT